MYGIELHLTFILNIMSWRCQKVVKNEVSKGQGDTFLQLILVDLQTKTQDMLRYEKLYNNLSFKCPYIKKASKTV